MKIKRFDQLNEGISQDKIEEFYNKVKDIMVGWDKAMEEEPENEPSHSELSQEVGDVMNDMNLTTQDLKDIVAAYPNDMYIEYYVKPQLEYEEKTAKQYATDFNEKLFLIKNILKEENDGYGVDDDTIEKIIKELEKLKGN